VLSSFGKVLANRASVLLLRIGIALFDPSVPSFRVRETMRAWGSRYARLVLERCANNKRQACRELGISYHTLQGYIRFRPEHHRLPAAIVDAEDGDASDVDASDDATNSLPP
jgi:hypothetical protein